MRKPFETFVGGDAHIAPFGSSEFAENFRKIGLYRWVDVGINPYEAYDNFVYQDRKSRIVSRDPGFCGFSQF